jgi:hypothetical protein
VAAALAATALALPGLHAPGAGAQAEPTEATEAPATTGAPATTAGEGTTTTTVAEDPGDLEIRLLEAPVARQDDPRARFYIVDHVAPGANFSRRLAVTNTSDAPVAVRAYTGGGNVRDGGFTFVDQPVEGEEAPESGDDAAAVDRARELASWVTVDPTDAELAPGAQGSLTATFRVPADAAPGERYGVVWAEMTSPAPDGTGAVQVHRVGIRVYLSVGAGNEPASDFTIGDPTIQRRDADGLLVATAPVENTGGRAVDISGEMTLSDGPNGLDAAPLSPEEQVTLAPGEAGTVTFPLADDLPGGDWSSRVELRSGEVERVRESRVTTPGPVTGGDNLDLPWAPIAAGIGGLTVVALLVVALLGLRRRRSPVRLPA